MMENVASILSGNSCSIYIRGQTKVTKMDTTSRNLESSKEPSPAPVPPPKE